MFALLIVCLSGTGLLYQSIASAHDASSYPAPGKLIDIGGYRLHLSCTGTARPGSPTVILEAGSANTSLTWSKVQPGIASFTRVCSYDRPGYGWSDTGPLHTQMATFRAIENGFSLVRQTSNGLAMTVDDEGQVLSASDYFTTDPQVMVATVPMQGVHTIYATIGDLFAWLSMAGLVGLIGVAIARRRKTSEAGAAEPREEPVVVS